MFNEGFSRFFFLLKCNLLFVELFVCVFQQDPNIFVVYNRLTVTLVILHPRLSNHWKYTPQKYIERIPLMNKYIFGKCLLKQVQGKKGLKDLYYKYQTSCCQYKMKDNWNKSVIRSLYNSSPCMLCII